jgi:hypothetical protein
MSLPPLGIKVAQHLADCCRSLRFVKEVYNFEEDAPNMSRKKEFCRIEGKLVRVKSNGETGVFYTVRIRDKQFAMKGNKREKYYPSLLTVGYETNSDGSGIVDEVQFCENQRTARWYRGVL